MKLLKTPVIFISCKQIWGLYSILLFCMTSFLHNELARQSYGTLNIKLKLRLWRVMGFWTHCADFYFLWTTALDLTILNVPYVTLCQNCSNSIAPLNIWIPLGAKIELKQCGIFSVTFSLRFVPKLKKQR